MKIKNLLLCILLLQLCACKKWLDAKSTLGDITPVSLNDYQALLDNDAIINEGTPGLGLTACDNYYVSFSVWQSRSAFERNGYIWAKDVYEGLSPQDWSKPYKAISYANIALEGLATIPVTNANQQAWNMVKGTALFFRAFHLFQLAQLFTLPYTNATADTDPGLPLRLHSDVNETVSRASIRNTYEQILSDLQESVTLLPVYAAYQTRPGTTAVYALLAKVYLTMKDYEHARENADKALAQYNTLIDFNGLTAAATVPLAAYPNNKEVILYTTMLTPIILANTNPVTDSVLYQSYAANDLRKTVFYKLNAGLPLFKGWYTGKNNSYFSGIGTNECWLIRAECQARLGNTVAAMADLNAMLVKRWKAGTFVPVTAATANDALVKIITERRKELPFTASVRWEDLRRLNTDPQFVKTLTRLLNGQTYSLPPNDPRYALPIPDDEIRISGIQQNQR